MPFVFMLSAVYTLGTADGLLSPFRYLFVDGQRLNRVFALVARDLFQSPARPDINSTSLVVPVSCLIDVIKFWQHELIGLKQATMGVLRRERFCVDYSCIWPSTGVIPASG